MPQNNSQSKQPARLHLKLPILKRAPQKSIFQEYPYVFFAAAFAFITILAKAGGMSLRDAAVLGAWLVSIAYFAWQVLRYRKEKSTPASVQQAETAAKPDLSRKVETTKKPVHAPPKPMSELTVSETKPPRWPPPPPRLVAPLSVTLSKKAQQAKKAEPENNSKNKQDKNPKP